MSRSGLAMGVALLLAGSVVAAGGARAEGEPAAAGKVEDLAWLAGAWRTALGEVQSEEHWMRPAGGIMLGMARTLAEGKTAFFEFLRIETRADGIYYVALPSARAATDFKATRVTASEVVFENPAHGFPKKIIYRLTPDGSLTARIEGDGTEKERPKEYRFRPLR